MVKKIVAAFLVVCGMSLHSSVTPPNQPLTSYELRFRALSATWAPARHGDNDMRDLHIHDCLAEQNAEAALTPAQRQARQDGWDAQLAAAAKQREEIKKAIETSNKEN